jgi:hypothetical protein
MRDEAKSRRKSDLLVDRFDDFEDHIRYLAGSRHLAVSDNINMSETTDSLNPPVAITSLAARESPCPGAR